jgi:hypothetical protein
VTYLAKIGDRGGEVRLSYRFPADQKDFAYSLALSTTGCQFGGVRWWFHCPLSTDGVPCGRRCRMLYLAGYYFGCRQCHRLTYRSTQTSDSRVYAAVRGGLDFRRFQNLSGMWVNELDFALKVLTFEQERLDRFMKLLGPDDTVMRGTNSSCR